MDVEKVSKAIAFLRKRAGYTQKELAERLGVSDKAVSKWERGLGLPDISCLRKLSILLDTDTDSLLAGDVIHHGSGWHGVLLLDKTISGVGLQTILYDKPLISFLLSYFLLVGIKKVCVICPSDEMLYMRKLFGDGEDLGISINYWEGTADRAMRECPSMAQSTNFMIVHGRTFIYGVDQTRFFQKAMLYRDRLMVLSLPRGQKAVRQKLNFDNDKKIICSGDTEELNTQYNYYDIPVVFCPQKLFSMVCQAITDGSVTDNSALAGQYMYTEVLDRGFVEMSVDTWEDVLNVSNFIKIVQQACGMNLYCPEEIAWRRGMISTEKLMELAGRQTDNDYKNYLTGLCLSCNNE